MYTDLPLRDRPPWHFRLAKWMIRNRILGGYHLVELGDGLLEVVGVDADLLCELAQSRRVRGLHVRHLPAENGELERILREPTPERVYVALEALRRGRTLNVSMMSANQRGITVPVTLVGFTRGFAELTEALR